MWKSVPVTAVASRNTSVFSVDVSSQRPASRLLGRRLEESPEARGTIVTLTLPLFRDVRLTSSSLSADLLRRQHLDRHMTTVARVSNVELGGFEGLFAIEDNYYYTILPLSLAANFLSDQVHLCVIIIIYTHPTAISLGLIDLADVIVLNVIIFQ
jgi:hypothetical protein